MDVQIKGIGGGGMNSPDAEAVGGTTNIVVGMGSISSKGGPSSNQILTLSSVNVVAGTRVVPAIVAVGGGGSGRSAPSTEAVGVVVLGTEGNGT